MSSRPEACILVGTTREPSKLGGPEVRPVALASQPPDLESLSCSWGPAPEAAAQLCPGWTLGQRVSPLAARGLGLHVQRQPW